MKKRLLSALLALCMVLALLPEAHAAADSGSCGNNVTWSYSDGTLTIQGKGDMFNFIFDYAPWYSFREQIHTVIIDDGVITIGTRAFLDCSVLTSVTIPDSVVSIWDNAFSNCRSLTGVTIPASVVRIMDDAFSGCTKLAAIHAASGSPYFASVDGVLFSADQTVLYVYPAGKTARFYDVPSTVTSIGAGSFAGCGNLIGVTIPDGVTAIGGRAFYDCYNLNSVIIPDSVTYIGTFAFSKCDNLRDATISAGVTSIDIAVFSGCVSLTAVTIPGSVTEIGEAAFSLCRSLTDIYYGGSESQWRQVYIAADNMALTKAAVHCGNSEFTVVDGILTSYHGNGGKAVIPDGVTAIGSGAFAMCGSVTDVVIPEGVAAIGDHAFEGCGSLSSVTIPKSAKTIGASAFHDCGSLRDVYYGGKESKWKLVSIAENNEPLTSAAIHCSDPDFSIENGVLRSYRGSGYAVTIPSEVTAIGDRAFFNRDSVIGVTIPKGVTAIGESAFESCSALTAVDIPDSITSIGQYAFANCPLTVVDIPASTVSIGEGAFSGCMKLANIRVASGNLAYVFVDGALLSADQTLLHTCLSRTAGTYRIPDTVTAIAAYAFRSCLNLTTVVIPDGVTAIDTGTFQYDQDLSSITIPASVTSIGENAFDYCYRLNNVYYGGSESQWNQIAIAEGNDWLAKAAVHFNSTEPKEPASGYCGDNVTWSFQDGVLTIEGTGPIYDADYGSDWEWPMRNYVRETHTIKIGSGVTSIGISAFSSFYNVTSVTIPDTVTAIGDDAFTQCYKLTNVVIPSGVTTIGQYAFADCSRLTGVTIPASVTTIGQRAFSGCDSLTGVTVPASVTSIGQVAFSGEKLTGIHVASGNPVYNSADGVLFNADRTTLYSYPSGKSGSYSIPASVTAIAEEAFYNCRSLTGVTIPNSVTTIGVDAFAYCVSLTGVTIPNSVTAIGVGAFSYSGLTYATIPSSVTAISGFVFAYCSELTNVAIPASVTSIADAAFFLCDSLAGVYYSGSEDQWSQIFIDNAYNHNSALYGAGLYCNYASPAPVPVPTVTFTDVPADRYYYEAVEWAVEFGVTAGTGDGATFSPDDICTHAQILTFLWRARGEAASSAQIPVAIDENAYYAGALHWAAEMRMIDEDFQPDAPCTRGEAMLYIWKAFGWIYQAVNIYLTDVPAGADYSIAVAWAVDRGITKGTSDTTFSPDNICTRAQIVTFLYRAWDY